ncbi:hypothetical protein BD410DRAFT_82137 [Rickenella mellea]|uniref:FAD-binding FR-type domain-containing protein n=1 Tax=Rickenella mellea TaxID=50990 RepID=A0A4Y7PLN3_9AGAM|nr:hypothetical protein BD410DRAFT_82137 [Rickenella mellea]
MSDAGAPPPVPPEFQIYNSYIIDPIWQRKFTIIWASALGISVLLALPRFLKSVRNGSVWNDVTGVLEDVRGAGYEPIVQREKKVVGVKSGRDGRFGSGMVDGVLNRLSSFTLWTIPYVGLDAGQIFIITIYFLTLLLTLSLQSQLISNPNRAGFLALSHLPPLFLLSSKNSLFSLLLGPGHGWEKLNYLHRWCGRGLFLCAGIHGALWIRNHLQYGLPILGQEKEGSGVAAFALLCVIVLSSLKVVRVCWYQVFFVVHIVAMVSFYVTICYHTIYASPWILPPLGFYGLDLLVRMLRHRIKDATLVACDDQMTLIHVHDAHKGWTAGQHVRLRVFFNARIFESHPLTILCAPPDVGVVARGSGSGGLVLGARVTGDWTRALNAYARSNGIAVESNVGAQGMGGGDEKQQTKEKINAKGNEIEEHPSLSPSLPTDPKYYPQVQVQVMLDGPYGGSSVDIGEYERVLLVAGGSGLTFTLGLLDDLVGRCIRRGRGGGSGERTRRVEFAWCVKSFGCIDWFAHMLMDIATAAAAPDAQLDLHITIFVTCLCNPEAVPPIPNCDVVIQRPSVRRLLGDLASSSSSSSSYTSAASSVSELPLEVTNGFDANSKTHKDVEKGEERRRRGGAVGRASGGIAVCAAGPESLMVEARNAVARFSLTRGGECGPVACHTEEYAI